ncbi:MAG: hypothetical protein ACRC8J_06685 [Phocaeicola sp.]
MKTRRNKTVAQQCRYYEVENIHEYIVSVYINGNFSQFKELYKELSPEARRQFIEYVFEQVSSEYRLGIIRTTI